MHAPATIWTIGHSTRPLAEFIGLLAEHRIQAVADVRRYPGSRRYPHFNPEPLRDALAQHGIDFTPMPGLGGRRRVQPDSRNGAWRNAAFQGYADYMQTPDFRVAVDTLLEFAARRRTAIMCAEAVWWRCHRSMIADWLKAHGIEVRHIMGPGKAQEHPYTSVARVRAGELSYVPDELFEAGDQP